MTTTNKPQKFLVYEGAARNENFDEVITALGNIEIIKTKKTKSGRTEYAYIKPNEPLPSGMFFAKENVHIK